MVLAAPFYFFTVDNLELVMESIRWNVPPGVEVDLAVEAGASYKLQSGYNVVRRVRIRLPNAGSEYVHTQPVENERAPNVGIFDIRIEKTFTIHPRWGRLTGILDMFNIMNNNPVTTWRNTSGSRYKEVVVLLDPRAFRFGIRYEF